MQNKTQGFYHLLPKHFCLASTLATWGDPQLLPGGYLEEKNPWEDPLGRLVNLQKSTQKFHDYVFFYVNRIQGVRCLFCFFSKAVRGIWWFAGEIASQRFCTTYRMWYYYSFSTIIMIQWKMPGDLKGGYHVEIHTFFTEPWLRKGICAMCFVNPIHAGVTPESLTNIYRFAGGSGLTQICCV